jgi:hypothetical protein
MVPRPGIEPGLEVPETSYLKSLSGRCGAPSACIKAFFDPRNSDSDPDRPSFITSTGTVRARWASHWRDHLRFHKPHDAAKYLKTRGIYQHRARTLPLAIGIGA